MSLTGRREEAQPPGPFSTSRGGLSLSLSLSLARSLSLSLSLSFSFFLALSLSLSLLARPHDCDNPQEDWYRASLREGEDRRGGSGPAVALRGVPPADMKMEHWSPDVDQAPHTHIEKLLVGLREVLQTPRIDVIRKEA